MGSGFGDTRAVALGAATRGPEAPSHPGQCAVLTVVGVVYGGVNPLLEAVMEIFLIALLVVAATGVAFFLFVIEPRRKIYDYDPLDPR